MENSAHYHQNTLRALFWPVRSQRKILLCTPRSILEPFADQWKSAFCGNANRTNKADLQMNRELALKEEVGMR